MALIAPFDHPLAIRPIAGSGTNPSLIPRIPAPDAFAGAPSSEVVDARQTIGRNLTHLLLTDAVDRQRAVADVVETVADDVVVWSPGLFVASRSELVTRMLESDDSLADVAVTISRTASDGGHVVFLEWQLRGRFRRAALLNEDILVEPSGATVESSGVVVMAFAGDRVRSIHCYYDLLGLFEQLLL